MLYSLNGEPLRGGALGMPTCEAARGAWFDRVDADHDGTISRDEFMADARAQFALMDLNHDGVITPAELSTFRLPYRPGGIAVASSDNEPVAPPKRPTNGHKHDNDPGAGFSSSGAGGKNDDPTDPVMSADKDLKFKVTRDDFMAQADENFAAHDGGHAGFLSRADILSTCPKIEK
jgi:hypothetical protein